MAPLSRERISSPLEAGHSIHDCYLLPCHLTAALEYVSRRLSRSHRAMHTTLVVVRRDYQLPSPPATSTVAAPSRLASLKQLVTKPGSLLKRTAVDYRASPSPTASDASAASTILSQKSQRWGATPASPDFACTPMTPATPFTVASLTTDGNCTVSSSVAVTAGLGGQFGARLVRVGMGSNSEQQTLQRVFERARKKFRLSPKWLPAPVHSSVCALPADLMHRSVRQNEILFSSESLTLLSLDHLYTFKAALQSYARTHSPCRLEDAVDELRRLVLMRGRQKLPRSALVGAYAWLGAVSDAALGDVNRMYGRAYGGIGREAGVEMEIDGAGSGWPLPSRGLKIGMTEQQHSEREMRLMKSNLNTKELPPLPLRAATLLGRRGAEEDEEVAVVEDADDKVDQDVEWDIDEIEHWYRNIYATLRVETADVVVSAAGDVVSAPASETIRRTETTFKASEAPAKRAAPVLKVQPSLPAVAKTKRPRPRPVILPSKTKFAEREGLIVGTRREDNGSPTTSISNPAIKASIPGGELEDEEEVLIARPRSAIQPTVAHFPAAHPSSSRLPLKLQIPPPQRHLQHRRRLSDHPPSIALSMSIGEILTSPYAARTSDSRWSSSSARRIPLTPNECEDISPITRGEWAFLMFGKGRRGGVELC